MRTDVDSDSETDGSSPPRCSACGIEEPDGHRAGCRKRGNVLPPTEIHVVKTPQYVSATTYMPNQNYTNASIQASHMDDGEWFLNRALVPPIWRGQGVGTRLLKSVLASAAEMGCKRMLVTPGGYDGETAKQYRFYRRNGFTTHTMPDEPAGLRDDERVLVWTP